MDDATWWGMFVEYWVARGFDRAEIESAVQKFRDAQSALTSAT